MPESSIRGYAWLVRPGVGFGADPNEIPWGGLPHPRYAWPIGPGEPGVGNPYGNLAFVALTDEPLPPEIRENWVVEPAELTPDFDTAGARLIVENGFRETPLGRVKQYSFELAGP